MKNVSIIDNADHAAIARWLALRLSSDGEAHTGEALRLTMPGGSTPFPILAELIAAHGQRIDWPRLDVWPNDDRIVPEDHEASNTGKMRALLEPTGAKVTALSQEASPPHFALVWLGMGPDGHIASLFPNTDPALDDPNPVRRLTPDPLPPHAPFDRITLTLPALLACDAIVFTLGGSEEKRAVFEAATKAEHDLPVARLLRAAHASGVPVTCFT